MTNGQKLLLFKLLAWLRAEFLCYTKAGEWLKRGERYGFIRFGSELIYIYH